MAAIECDGATYHSGVSVRDRDRIRQEILESLGWRNRIWRIWSTDWFRNPLAETDRLLNFLAELTQQSIPDEYVIEAEGTPAHSETEAAGSDEAKPEELVFDDEDELEVEIGDLVTYTTADMPEAVNRVTLTSRQTIPSLGLAAASTPLGQVLLGATVGETIMLRVPGKGPQALVVQKIQRQREFASFATP